MSIEVELNKKAGRVCREALAGLKHCPLIVRSTSEDVMTGNVFGTLRHIRPHLWLGPLLNLALGTRKFRQVWYKKLSIRLWERQDRFPQELLDFREGRTEPDVIIEWENPPTTVWIEAKLHAPLAEGTSNHPANNQVIRGIRTLLAATGQLQPHRLFRTPLRRAIWLALLSYKPEPLVDRYRDPVEVFRALPYPDRLASLPQRVEVGTIAWRDVAKTLQSCGRLASRHERMVADELVEYLCFKCNQPRSR